MEIRDRYRDYIPVYTDGSRDGIVIIVNNYDVGNMLLMVIVKIMVLMMMVMILMMMT